VLTSTGASVPMVADLVMLMTTLLPGR
jgi:hypothetical protein